MPVNLPMPRLLRSLRLGTILLLLAWAITASVAAAADPPAAIAPTDPSASPATSSTSSTSATSATPDAPANPPPSDPGLSNLAAGDDAPADGGAPVPPDGEAAAPSVEPMFTPQQTREMIELLAEVDQPVARRVQQMMDRNPERAQAMLRQQWPMLNELMQLRQRDPEVFKLKVEDFRTARRSYELARRLRQARQAGDDAARSAVEKDLRELITHHFEVRQAIRQRELAKLSDELERLRKQFEERQAARDRIIEHRLQTLMTEIERKQW